MDKYIAYLPSLPSLLLVAVFVALMGNPPSWGTAAFLAVACCLWGFHFYYSRPEPPPPPSIDEIRFGALENQVKELKKQLDSVSTAVNMRQIR